MRPIFNVETEVTSRESQSSRPCKRTYDKLGTIGPEFALSTHVDECIFLQKPLRFVAYLINSAKAWNTRGSTGRKNCLLKVLLDHILCFVSEHISIFGEPLRENHDSSFVNGLRALTELTGFPPYFSNTSMYKEFSTSR
ncbi:hypothetical protein BDV98DRAFT_575251 [Pterulicium gracile]|uniref:Uncharacterized protein n=1 Tax=Pterulicium gracile TaxID=1884261 RepID=A0A5C3Q4H1_9AGAR|nr:hypothetical protein BDV98DRAFT_575251 [Pterula gracilis]